LWPSAGTRERQVQSNPFFPNRLREKPIIVTPSATSIDPKLRMRYRHLAMVHPHCSVGPIAI
jgi:hypothetical protein